MSQSRLSGVVWFCDTDRHTTKPVEARHVLIGQSVIKNVRLMNALQESKASEKVHFNLLVLQGREEYAQLE